MDDRTHTVALFFGLLPDGGGVPEDAAAKVARATKEAVHEAATQFAVIKSVLDNGVPATQWAAAASQMIALLHKELADLSIPALLARGWTKYEPFREYCDESKHPPNTRAVVPLNTHTLRSVHRPVVELRIDGAPAGRLNFEVELSFTIKSVSLVIMNKKFIEADFGAVEAEGTIKCEEIELFKKKLGKFEPPLKFPLGDGYPIDPLGLMDRRARETTA